MDRAPEWPMGRGKSARVVRSIGHNAPAPGLEPTLVVIAAGAPSLVREACRHARANGWLEVYCLYVASSGRGHEDRERSAIEEAVRSAFEEGVELVSMRHVRGNIAEAVIQAAEACGARLVVMNGVERRRLVSRIFGRPTLRRIRRRLGPERSVLSYD